MIERKYENQVAPARVDADHLRLLRANVETFYRRIAAEFLFDGAVILDVAPEVHAGFRPYCTAAVSLETVDVNAAAACTYTADLCARRTEIPGERFDLIICTEVLEHTLHPFNAVQELRRILKPAGRLCVSTPFNFRIHGPLPDCWRFTEHGLRALFSSFEIEELSELPTPDRPLMPIHYTLIAQKPA